MPVQFTIPPDTRAVGTGDPPGDMDNVVRALNASSAQFNVLSTQFAGGADPTNVADSTAAFQAAITAATVLNGDVVIPPGDYNLATGGLAFTGPVRFRGLGAALSYSGAVTNPAVTLNGPSNSNHLFTFPFGGSLWGGLEVENVGISYAGSGDVFHQINVTDSSFRNMLITLTGQAGMAFQTSGVNSLLNVLFERANITTTSAIRTNPMVWIKSSVSGAVSNNTHFKCKFTNAGLDCTQYAVVYECNGTGAAYHFADNIRDCWFEQCFGGCYKSLSGQNITTDGSVVWDNFPGQAGLATTVAAGSNGGTISGIAAWASPSAGVLSVASTAGYPAAGRLNVAASGPTTAIIAYTGIAGSTFTGCTYISGSPVGTVATGGVVSWSPVTGNSLFYHGASAGNSGSQGVRITGTGRSLQGPDGVTTWDVECEATTSQVHVEGYTVRPPTPSSTVNAYMNFHGCNDVTLINNQSPQGSAVNGNSATVITNPSPTQAAISQGVITPPSPPTLGFVPSDLGYLAWTYDPALSLSVAGAVTSGTVNIFRILIRAPVLVTSIELEIGTAGVTLTAGQNLLGLVTPAGTQIGITADQSAAWVSTGLKTAALTGGPFVLSPPFVWAELLSVGATPPLFARLNNVNATITNTGAAATTNFRCATNVTGQTALPSPLVPASSVAAAQILFIGLK
jgi:hypothetical protein